MKNPWVSLWLSAANTAAGTARGFWMAEFRRQQKRHSRLREIPVVCLSARHDARQTAERLGLREFLRKPFDLDDVVGAVRRHCAT